MSQHQLFFTNLGFFPSSEKGSANVLLIYFSIYNLYSIIYSHEIYDCSTLSSKLKASIQIFMVINPTIEIPLALEFIDSKAHVYIDKLTK